MRAKKKSFNCLDSELILSTEHNKMKPILITTNHKRCLK